MSAFDSQRLLSAILAVQERFIADRNEEDRERVWSVALTEVLALSGAELGCVVQVRQREAGPYLKLLEIDAVEGEHLATLMLYLHDLFGNRADAESLPRPLLGILDSTEPLILGYEPRLPALDNLMSLPVVLGGELSLIFALANRPEGFERALMDDFEPFLVTCRSVIAAHRGMETGEGLGYELERAERRFQAFMDASDSVAYITDSDRRVRWLSQAFCDKFHVDITEVLNRREDELIPASLAARTRAIDEQVRETNDVVKLLEPAVGIDGEIQWWKGAKFPVEGTGGEPLIGGVAVDVTETVRMNETLRERELELTEVQEAARIGRWTWVVQRDRVGWDQQFERLCGVPARDEHGLGDLLDLLHPDDVERTRETLEDGLREGLSRLTLSHRMFVDGEIRELETVAKIRRESDAGPVVVALARDVTDRRELELDRRELEAKAHRFDSLAVLVDEMIREFDELLVGVLGNAGIALDDVSTDSLAAACIQDIEASAEQATRLTRQMQAFSGRGQLASEEIELSSLVAGLADDIHEVISSDINVRLSLAPELPVFRGDVGQLNQLVLSLVANASEATVDGVGEVGIATGSQEIVVGQALGLVGESELEPGTHVWVEITDQGVGVDEELRERVFEPFFSTKFAGWGVGLAATLGIVRGHGGGIVFDSRPGEGTRVRVLFPVSAEAAREDGEYRP